MTRTFGLLTILLVLVTAAPLTAKTVSHPKNSPSFTIDFPDSWKVEVTPEGEIYAASPDEEVEYELWRLPQKEVSSSALAALKVAVKDVNEYIREHVTSAKFGDWNEEKYNDMDFLWAEGTGKYKDGGRVSIGVYFFSPDNKSIYVLMYWGAPAAEKKHKKDIEAIDKSIKKTGK